MGQRAAKTTRIWETNRDDGGRKGRACSTSGRRCICGKGLDG